MFFLDYQNPFFRIKFFDLYESQFSPFQQECDNYIIRSLNYEMYLQRVKKSTLSPFDDKRCYESNIKKKPWE